MAYVKSPSTVAAEEVQHLLNLGLFYSVITKGRGEAVSHHFTLANAKRAKTRKTRVISTCNLLIEKVYNDGTKSICN